MKDTICNLCGHSCSLGPLAGVPKDGRSDEEIRQNIACKQLPGWDVGGLLDYTVMGGYNSTPGNGEGALDDCTGYNFSLCEFCLDYLFTKMVIPPRVQSVHSVQPKEVFRPAAQRVVEDDWRKEKDEFFAEAERRAKSRKSNSMKGKI
jgi:hypothetical protein